MFFPFKGVLCCFGGDISIIRERSSFNYFYAYTDLINKKYLFSCLNKLYKQTFKNSTISYF